MAKKTGAGKAAQAGRETADADRSQDNAIEALKQDHRRVEQLFDRYEQTSDDREKSRLIDRICSELVIHTRIEEEIFYPACRDAGCEADTLDEAQVEHDSAKMLIADLMEGGPRAPFADAKVSVLSEMIKHHVAEEEKPDDGLFAQADEHDVDTPELARRLRQRKQELQEYADDLRPSHVVSFRLDFSQFEEEDRPYSRYGRDERLYRRDDERPSGWRGAPRGRHEDYRRSGYHDDERGAFGGDGDRYYYYGRSAEPGSPQRGSREHGSPEYGGWFGDPSGHAQAARRGWHRRR